MTSALYLRYRPGSFADVIGQDHVTVPLRQALRNGSLHHAYLFSGPRGCGKTSSARIMARCLNCAQGPTDTPCGECESCIELAPGGPGSIDVVEIDAASHGGVDDARALRERASFAPARDRHKIFILDEAHMVTPQGFNALLKLVEEPPPHVSFIFATTSPEKVIGTIRSRTHHYPFRLVPPEILLKHLERICKAEGVPAGSGVLPLVVRAGAGSVRDALSVLDQLIAGSGEQGLDYGQAIDLLGYTPEALLDDVVDALAANDGAAVFQVVERVLETGHDPRRFVEDLLERLRDLVVLATAGEAGMAALPGISPDQADRLRAQSGHLGRSELSRAADLVNASLSTMAGATSPRMHLELLMARLLLPGADGVNGLGARVERVERLVAAGGGAGIGGGAGHGASGAGVGGPLASVGGAPDVPARESRGTTIARHPASGGNGSPLPPIPAVAQPARLASVPAAPADGDGAEADDSGVADSVPVDAPAAEDRGAADGSPTRAGDGNPASAGADGHAAANADEDTAADTDGRAVASADGHAVAGHGVDTAAAPVAGSARETATSAPPASTPPAAAPPASTPPAAAPPASTPPGAADTQDTEMLRRRWPEVLDTLSRLRKVTWILVSQHAEVGSLDASTLHLTFDAAGNLAAFGNGPHADLVAQAVRDTLAVQVRVDGVLAGGPSGGPGGGRGGAGRGGAGKSAAPAARGETASGSFVGDGARARAEQSWGITPSDPSGAAEPSAPEGRSAMASADLGSSAGEARHPAVGAAATHDAAAPEQPGPAATRPTVAAAVQADRSPVVRQVDRPAAGRAPARTATDDPYRDVPPWDDVPPEPDDPSPDDPDLAMSTLQGAPLIAQLLGGTVIDEQVDDPRG